MEKNVLMKELENVSSNLKNSEDNIMNEDIKDIYLNIATKDSSPVFILNKRRLNSEGKVRFKLDSFICTISENKYKLMLELKYQIGNYNPIYERYTVEHDRQSLKSDYLVKEVIKQISQILDKDIITKSDFKDFLGTAEIITEVDNEGIPYSKFIDIQIERTKISSYRLENFNVLEKDFYDLNKNDEENLVKVFNLDEQSSMYKDKLSIIESFCEHDVDVDNFLCKGKTIMKLTADLNIKIDSSVDDLSEYVHDYVVDKVKYFDIKPSCILIIEGWCVLEYFPKTYFHLKNWSDYLGLLIDFVTHLENINIEGIEINYRPLDEDITRDIDENTKTLSNVKFTKELFDSEDHIEFYGDYAYFLDI